ncbi:MAG: hypothetical protein AUI14_07655 [Actinobacteria bacterium 13_2_20CM_2_71_6]|nr:MAG: hypothetical protein AUI14_07655 [Actinobacteria bacterium 13_2_20CM_2_71_6]
MLPVNGEGSAEQHSADPTFRTWRRSRPFWGGLFLIVSGLEFYVSAHFDFLPVKAAFGSQGFLSWLVPLALVLCGLLTWITPAQRIFYGVIGAATAVSAMIGLNLGGFFVGMLLGVVGGALAVAWTQSAPPQSAPPPDGVAEPGPVEPEYDYREDGYREDVETTDRLPGGPLTDHLPDAPTSPLGVPPVQGGRHSAGKPGEPPPDPPARLLTLLLLVTAVTAALLALPAPDPAAAAPCGPSAPPSTSTSPSAGPTSASPADGGFWETLGRWFGIKPGAAPSPSASPSPSPSRPAPSASCPAPRPTPSKTTGGTRKLALPPGQPVVNQVPSLQIVGLLTQSVLSYDGIVDLPVHGGTLRALQFSMSSSTSSPFELRVPAPNGGTISLTSSKLTVSGHVRFYATRIKGRALGLLPVDYTPDSPPLLVPPEMFFTNATVELVFVHCDLLTAPNLRIAYL